MLKPGDKVRCINNGAFGQCEFRDDLVIGSVYTVRAVMDKDYVLEDIHHSCDQRRFIPWNECDAIKSMLKLYEV